MSEHATTTPLTLAAANLAIEVTRHASRAWELERDRLYAELAELRDEVHAQAPGGTAEREAVKAEFAMLNGRMEKLTAAVAGLMANEGSVRV